ncbi:MAG: 5'/3'-nucleotidase SurE [Candidatus Melainabacteria bacterium]|nr:5'/3'-nucleotidase SurE [Candidatus Melainabacteria bacterium]
MKRLLSSIIFVLIICLTFSSATISQAVDALPKSDFYILLSNDDGYNAPGLKALAEALSPIAMVTVAAPAKQQSGAGHGITYREAIFVSQIKNHKKIPWYAISARPATCVHIGIENLIKTKPDLVISGINKGENLGPVTFRSGTAGAAREAAILGFPAIATSLQGNNRDDYKASAIYVRKLVEKLISKKLLQPKLLLNINFPAGISKGIKGTKVTKLSLIDETNTYHKKHFPFFEAYKTNITKLNIDNDPETDINAFANGYVTITPLSIDQTNYPELKTLKGIVND